VPAPDKTPSRIAGMFDAIAPRYDLLNHLLSAGMDRRWRDRAVEALALPPGTRIVDLCTGTGDLAIAATRLVAPVSVVGIDFSGEMLRLARAKLRALNLDGVVHLIRADAVRIPLPAACCDAATIGFGIRNVAEPDRALTEIARVLRSRGRLAILEFGFPRVPGIRTLYRWYFRYLLPLVGRTVSKHKSAYSYLPASVGAFPTPEAFRESISRAGFASVRAIPLTFGIVYLFVAEKS
jgi:demethylmenaquinone methyltransferase/2-methoxy-6-polyprenyl-1,4-benzoquinol methylase